jgi:transcription elongation factor Elf1
MTKGPDPVVVTKGPDPFVTCPFCGAREVELVSQFGGQLMTSQWQCKRCGSYFEAVREDFAERESL